MRKSKWGKRDAKLLFEEKSGRKCDVQAEACAEGEWIRRGLIFPGTRGSEQDPTQLSFLLKRKI